MIAAPPASCGSCGAALRERQRWCLACGNAALRRVVAPARWRRAALAGTIVAILALAGIGVAIAALAGG